MATQLEIDIYAFLDARANASDFTPDIPKLNLSTAFDRKTKGNKPSVFIQMPEEARLAKPSIAPASMFIEDSKRQAPTPGPSGPKMIPLSKLRTSSAVVTPTPAMGLPVTSKAAP